MKARQTRQDEHLQPTEASSLHDSVLTKPILLTVPQAAQQMGLSPAMVYKLVASEGLPTVKLRRSTRIAYSSLIHWLKGRENEQRPC